MLALVIGASADGRMLMVNAGFARRVGLAETQRVGRSAVELGLWDEAEARRRREACAGRW